VTINSQPVGSTTRRILLLIGFLAVYCIVSPPQVEKSNKKRPSSTQQTYRRLKHAFGLCYAELV
jgi:hypothetical protein